MNISIRNIDKKDWKELRIQSIKHNMNIGQFISHLLKEYMISLENADDILHGKKYLTDKDAKIIKKRIKEFREGF